VHYGGKYSVPVLVEILNRPSSPVKQQVITALARLQDVRGAEALVDQMGNGSERHTAFEALQEMGPVAEAPVIDAATSEDREQSLAAIELLGRIGRARVTPSYASWCAVKMKKSRARPRSR
jgi:HEAT repeat protein